MKINSKIISIPPYISVTWDQVASLQTTPCGSIMNQTLIISLMNGKEILIPDLDSTIISSAFREHARFVETTAVKQMGAREEQLQKSPAAFMQQLFGMTPEQLNGMPIRLGIAGLPGFDGIDNALHHNGAQAATPDLPKEVVEKIASIAKMMTGGDLTAFPKPEAHCNCTHCQVSRTIHGIEKNQNPVEEQISEEDLRFRSWDITKIGESLYSVTNPLDHKECYTVYLGTPVGCTCGQPHCEHLKAVLSS